MRLVLDVFYLKYNSCDGVDNLKYEFGIQGKELGCGGGLIVIGIFVVIVVLDLYEIFMRRI